MGGMDTDTTPQRRRGPSRGQRIMEVYGYLRSIIPQEKKSSRELLRDARRLVDTFEVPKDRKPKRRKPWATTSAERRMSVDYAIRNRGFGIFSDVDGVFDDSFDGADRRFDSAYADFQALSAD